MTSAVPVIPPSFQETILNTYGAFGEAWLLALPALRLKYLQLWKLEVAGEFAGLSFNYVLPVVQADHSLAVLKMGPHRKGRAKEISLLQAYRGQGAVQVLNSSLEDGVVLLEHVLPGGSLRESLAKGVVSDSQATEIAGHLMKRLFLASTAKNIDGLTPVSVWGLGFEKFLRENCRGADFPVEKVIRADRLFHELMSTSPQEVALHGDLHHSNILQSAREPWLAIDPKGVCGDPAYEAGAFVRNPMPELIESSQLDLILLGRLQILSSVLQVEMARLWAWSYSQSVLAAIWTLNGSVVKETVKETVNPTTAHQQVDWKQWLVVAESLERIERRAQ